MNLKLTNILLVEDDTGDVRLVRQALAEAGDTWFNLKVAKTLTRGISYLKESPVDVVLLDLSLPDSNGLKTFKLIQAQVPHLPVILLTDREDDAQADNAVREGAQDYLVKSQINSRLLVRSIRYAIDRTRAEEALRASEEKFREVTEQSTDGIVIADDRGIVIEWNRKQEEIFGYEKNEFLGKPLWEAQFKVALPAIQTPQLLEQVRQRILRILQDPHSEYFGKTIETEICRKDGTIRNIESTIYPIRVGDHFLVGSATRDITGRKRAEQALIESEARYRALYISMKEGVAQFQMLYNPAGEAIDYLCLDCNPAFENLVGLKRDQIIATKASEAHDKSLPPNLEVYATVAATGKSARFEANFESRQKSFSISVFSPGKGYFATVFEDITERNQALDALRESEARYRTLTETAHDMIFIINRQGKIEYVNEYAAQMVGSRGMNVVGQNTAEYFNSQALNRQEENLRKVFEFGEPLYSEGETQFPVGKYWLGTWLVPIKKENGEVVSVFGISRDLTERKQAEESLRLRVEQLVAINQVSQAVATSLDLEQVLAEVMNLAGRVAASDYVSIVMVDEAGRISRGMENMPGVLSIDRRARKRGFTSWIIRSRRTVVVDEIGEDGSVRPRIGKGAPRAINPHLTEMGIKSFAGLPLTIEEHIVGVLYLHSLHPGTFNNQMPLLTTFANQVAIAIERASLYNAVQKELAGRKQVEDTLRQSEKRFRALIENSTDAISLINARGTVTYSSSSYTRLLGYAREQRQGRNTFELVHPDDREYVVKLMTKLLQEPGQIALPPTRVRRADGSWLWVEGVAQNLLSEPGVQAIVVNFRDISERRQAEQAQQQSEIQFRALFELSPDAVMLLDPHDSQVSWPIVDCNEAACLMNGYRRDELIGQSIDKVNITRGTRDERIKYMKQLKEVGNLKYETSHRHKKGTVFPVEVSTTLIKIGERELVIGIDRDITERKRAEENLVKTEQIYRRAITQAGSVPYQSDYRSKKYTFLGEGFENLTGYAPAEMTGALFTSRLRRIEAYGEHKDLSHEQRVNLARQGGMKEWREDYEFERKDGGLVWLADHAVPLYGDNGDVIGSLGILTDITERMQAEEALRESEERFRIVFENANDAIFFENDQDEILSVNPRACKMMGFSADELLKMHVTDLQAPEVRSPGNVLRNELLEHGTSIFEGLNLHSSGRTIPVEISVGRIEHPKGNLYVSIVRDVSERKRTEVELARQADELRRRNEELARLYRTSGSLISGASLNLQEQAQRIVEVVQQEFGQDNCSLLVIQKDPNDLVRLAAAGPHADQVKYQALTLDGPGLIPLAIRTNKVINVGNVQSNPDYVQGWDLARSEMAVPLKFGNNVIGAIDVQSSEMNVFSPDDEHLMSLFAERAALGLEHSRLNTQTEARIQQLVALRTVDMAITGSFDINLTLGILLDQVLGQLGVHAADILTFHAATQTLKLACERGFRTRISHQTQLNIGMGYAWRAVRERRAVSISNLETEPAGSYGSPNLSGEQFTAYVGIPLIARGQIRGVLEIFHREPFHFEPEGDSFLEILAGQAAIAIDNAELFDNLQSSNSELSLAYDSTLEGWASALELRDQDTAGHTRRATELTIQLAQAMGIKENDIVHIYRGALLHDIGKMGVPDRIVQKPGPLTEEEWISMRRHPQYAYDMLSPILYLRLALDIPYCHHERWDGSGYPRRLKGDQIPLSARIFAVVDVWDALTSERPYRKAWPQKKAITYIGGQSGIHFDPKVVEIFLREVSHD